MKEQSKDLQFLFKQELLRDVKDKITPNKIKKKNRNNYKLDSTILNQIRNFRNLKKNHETKRSLENQENVNNDQKALWRVIEEQDGLRRVNKNQKALGRVLEDHDGLKRVNGDHERLTCVIEHRGKIINKCKFNLFVCIKIINLIILLFLFKR